jgi:CheY-like chemotaxis protein
MEQRVMTVIEIKKETPAVLVVEDDEEIREALKEILSSEGYRVHTATNGQEGLDHLRSNSAKPGIIILDLMMPIMDGWHFRNHQLQDPDFAKIPVIVITADGNASQKAKAMNATAGLKKPLNLEEFLKTIQDSIIGSEPC